MQTTQTQRKDRLNDIIRAKIAVQLTLNHKNTHQEIADFYGISRQLVTLVASEFHCRRTATKGLEGSLTHPKRTKADIEKINEKFSDVHRDKLKMIVNLEF